MPTELILDFLAGVFFGLVIGGAGVWSFGSSRARRTQALVAELQGDLSGSEARLEETRDQLTESKSETTRLSGELRRYERAWSDASAKLQERERSLQEQKALVEKAKTELADTFKALAA
jgi:chromosome segregation ATPase